MGNRGLEDFIAEATEILESLGSELLALSAGTDAEAPPEVLNAVFRSAHSLKGLAALFGQDAIASLAHALEDLLDQVRLGRSVLSERVLDALLDALDVLNALLAALTRGEGAAALSARTQAAVARLEREASARPGSNEADPLDRLVLDPHVRAVFTEYEEHRLRESVRKSVPLFRVRANFDLADFDTRLGELNARLKPLGELISTLPSSEPGDPSTIAFDLLVGARVEAATLARELAAPEISVFPVEVREADPALEQGAARGRVRGGFQVGSSPTLPAAGEVRVHQGVTEPPGTSRSGAVTSGGTPGPGSWAPRATDGGLTLTSEDEGGTLGADFAARQGELSMRSLSRTVRVDIGRLDALMHLVGELMLSRSTLARLSEQARGGQEGIGTAWAAELNREGRQLERRLGALQKGLLEARMVPLGQVFDRLARVVRRAAREAGKELEFTVSGGQVELDKLIVEELSDPLMHIIRNAIDHGIEAPEVRERSGKPRRGTVSLTATPRGNHVVLEVGDDGAGMDSQRIREVAIERGLVTVEASLELSRRELLNLIFQPGFSTAREVSSLSGRGVGLDVVKTNLAHLAGIIDLWSEQGQGSRFTLTLPVTLAILRALVVESSGRTYAVPLNSVIEIVAPDASALGRVEGREVLTIRGQTVPLARLSRLLGHEEALTQRPFAILVGIAQERLALMVDALGGQRDIVTQPLPSRLSGTPGLAGATSLGDRGTVLVLDVAALVELALHPGSRRAHTPVAPEASQIH